MKKLTEKETRNIYGGSSPEQRIADEIQRREKNGYYLTDAEVSKIRKELGSI